MDYQIASSLAQTRRLEMTPMESAAAIPWSRMGPQAAETSACAA